MAHVVPVLPRVPPVGPVPSPRGEEGGAGGQTPLTLVRPPPLQPASSRHTPPCHSDTSPRPGPARVSHLQEEPSLLPSRVHVLNCPRATPPHLSPHHWVRGGSQREVPPLAHCGGHTPLQDSPCQAPAPVEACLQRGRGLAAVLHACSVCAEAAGTAPPRAGGHRPLWTPHRGRPPPGTYWGQCGLGDR